MLGVKPKIKYQNSVVLIFTAREDPTGPNCLASCCGEEEYFLDTIIYFFIF